VFSEYAPSGIRIFLKKVYRLESVMLRTDLKSGCYLALIEKRHSMKFYTFLEKNRKHFTGRLNFIDRIKNENDAANAIERAANMIVEGSGFFWGIWRNDDIIGMISMRDINENLKSAEIAYSIDHEYEGKGLISEATWIAIDYLFSEYDVERLVLGSDVNNQRSQNIALKYGFTNEGIARKGFRANGEFQDCINWSLLKEEYLDLKTRKEKNG
jgi:ribosomal-protein-serine acetyltransferase